MGRSQPSRWWTKTTRCRVADNRMKANRYYETDSPTCRKYDIAIYPPWVDADECPHDYILYLTKKEFRDLLGQRRLPPKKGFMYVGFRMLVREDG